MNKKELSERDICTKFITPALRQAGWDEVTQLREEVSFTKGRIIVRGKMSDSDSGGSPFHSLYRVHSSSGLGNAASGTVRSISPAFAVRS